MDRRSFLKAGILTSTLTVSGVTLSGCAKTDILDTELINDDVSLALTAMIPVLLAGALPSNEPLRSKKVATVIAAMRVAMQRFPPQTLEELNDLFGLLTNRMTMLVYVGQFAHLNNLTAGQVTLLIEGWRTSAISLLNTAYEGLKELVFAAYYGNPDNWAALGYHKPNIG